MQNKIFTIGVVADVRVEKWVHFYTLTHPLPLHVTLPSPSQWHLYMVLSAIEKVYTGYS
jgi:hypothetical protein